MYTWSRHAENMIPEDMSEIWNEEDMLMTWWSTIITYIHRTQVKEGWKTNSHANTFDNQSLFHVFHLAKIIGPNLRLDTEKCTFLSRSVLECVYVRLAKQKRERRNFSQWVVQTNHAALTTLSNKTQQLPKSTTTGSVSHTRQSQRSQHLLGISQIS